MVWEGGDAKQTIYHLRLLRLLILWTPSTKDTKEKPTTQQNSLFSTSPAVRYLFLAIATQKYFHKGSSS